MGGTTIVPRRPKTKRNKKNFKNRPNFFYFYKSCMTLLYLLIRDFPKLKLNALTVTGMALCVNLGPKSQNLFL
jgi:hypothetical protein